jgi:hypothetical protein
VAKRNRENEHANEVVLRHVMSRLSFDGAFNGQIILHVHAGVVTKTETRQSTRTRDLLDGVRRAP